LQSSYQPDHGALRAFQDGMPAYDDLTGEEQDAFDKQVFGPPGGGAGGVDSMSQADLPSDGAIVDRGTGRGGRVSLNEMRLGYGDLDMNPSEAAVQARAALAKDRY
jgi:hypothetical protein